MKTNWFCRSQRWARLGNRLAAIAFAIFALWAPLAVHAGAPEWLRALAREPLGAYPSETEAVQLLDEQITTVRENGEIRTLYRRAYKILRPQGRHWGTAVVHFDSDSRLTFLKAWSIPAQGGEYEVKEKDAVETSLVSDSLYSDNRQKILTIPAADPGSVVGYEFEQRRRPEVLQDSWWFQDSIPVRHARYLLELPKGWEHSAYWLNHEVREPRPAGENRWMWEVADVPALESEPSMPSRSAIQARLGIKFFAGERRNAQATQRSWEEVALWYWQLAGARRQSTPAIRQQVASLTASLPGSEEKVRALAAYVQRQIRYVAIEIGIGGYQPHAASDVFTNKYGDCKDKVTLLSAMLGEIGVDSHYILVHTSRGAVQPVFPSMLSFNHVILGIRVPAGAFTDFASALVETKSFGRLLFFDPTDDMTPLGELPPGLQASQGLIVSEDGGALAEFPLAPSNTNRLLRTGKMTLGPDGTLTARIQELYFGYLAANRRTAMLAVPLSERARQLERRLGFHLGDFVLTNAKVVDLDKIDSSFGLIYEFKAANYAKRAGNLFLLRPRVLGQKSDDVLELKERKNPVEFTAASLETDIFEITLPPGYVVDELPPPVEAEIGAASYKSRIELDGNVLRYRRDYEIREVHVGRERFEDLKKFFRQIASDERSNAVLKRAQ